MLLKSLLLLALLSAFLFSYTSACSCMFLSPEDRIKSSANVFHGDVLSVSATDYQVTYKVRVNQSCKLDKSRVGSDGTVKVATSGNGAMCGVTGLKVGSSYTFLADEQMWLGSCTWDGNADWAETNKICQSIQAQVVRPAVVTSVSSSAGAGSPGNVGSAVCACNKILAQVCAAVANGPKTTYSNACEAECAGAVVIHQGACGQADGHILVDPAVMYPHHGFPAYPGSEGGNTGFVPPPRVNMVQGHPVNGGPAKSIHSAPFFPSHPPQQPFMMTMKDAVNEVCSLCDRMRRSQNSAGSTQPMPRPTPGVYPVDSMPFPMPIEPHVRPMPIHHDYPMQEPAVLEPGNCMCMMMYAPVCAVNKDGVNQTYGNSCQAGCAAAKVVHEGECGTNNIVRTMPSEIAVDAVHVQ